MNEFRLDKDYMKGDFGPYVWIIQEWLCLHGINIVIDGSFGPATEAAVKKFQLINILKSTGAVEGVTYGKLIEPLISALKPIPVNGQSLRELIVAYAQQHLKQHPMQIGSRNMGPWIRYYMEGYKGSKLSWSACFVSSIVKQASLSLGIEPPLKTSYYHSELANNAKKSGLFLSERAVLADKSKLRSGFIFLSREFPGYWTHSGIVIEIDDEIILTIEANTNDEGSVEGYEVCQRIRNYDSKDFIIV